MNLPRSPVISILRRCFPDSLLLACVLQAAASLLTGPGVLPSRPNVSLICSYNSALKTLVLPLVKGRVDAGDTSPPELIHGLALNPGGFCGRAATKAGLTPKNL